jgi:hypothetical protein
MDRKAPAAAVQPHVDQVERGAAVRAQIGTQLRKMYAEVVGEGVPICIAEILRLS